MEQEETKGSESQSTERSWAEETEEALNRAGDSLRAAWEGSREARLTALEAAREAASRLGEAIDRGIGVARETWAGGKQDNATAEAESEEE